MTSKSSCISDPDFCPECRNILPLPGAKETVFCLVCGFKVSARVVDVETCEIKFDNKGKYRKKEECKDVANAEPLIQQNIGQECEEVKEIQYVPSEFIAELCKDCAISSGSSYNISISTDILPPAAPNNPDIRPAPTPVRHKRGPPISPVCAIKKSNPTESTTGCSRPSSTSQSNADMYKKTTDSKSRKHDAGKEKKEVEKKSKVSSYGRDLVEELRTHILQNNQSVPRDNIVDLAEAKKLLEKALLFPIWMSNFYKGMRRPWQGVLMVGPSGTEKAMLAKVVATECKATFFNVSCSTLICKYRDGESEKLVSLIFEMARFSAPSMIFIDEIDSICSRKVSEYNISRRVKSELLIQMEGITSIDDPNKAVMLVAASDCPWDIDETLRKKFKKCIYIPLPNVSGREALLKKNLRELEGGAPSLICPNLDLKEVTNSLRGYSGDDIFNVCSDAAMRSVMRRVAGLTPAEIFSLPKEELELVVSPDDFREAIKKINKSVSTADLEKYHKWMAEFGST